MEFQEIDLALEHIVEWRMATPEQIFGCSEDEIRTVRDAAGGRLPASYEHFLRRAGNGAGEFCRDDQLFYPQMLELKDKFLRLLQREGVPSFLRASDYPFSSHGDYQFLYFDVDAGEDPPILYYMEGDPPRVVTPSFSAWLTIAVDDESRLYGR